MKRAAILNIGSELLVGHTLNTHANYLSKELNDLGYSVYYHLTVGDNRDRILSALEFLGEASDLILCTGGLGPTVDDITREVVADFCGVELLEDSESMNDILSFFETNNYQMTPNNKLQAFFPKGSKILKNKVGTAPGFIVNKGKTSILALPGPPRELYSMMKIVVPMLRGEANKLYSEFIHMYGIGESNCADKIDDLFKEQNDPSMGIYAGDGIIKIRLSTMKSSEKEARETIRPLREELVKRLSTYVFSENGEMLGERLLSLLRQNKLKISFAESCTGGVLAKTITDIPGSSEAFEGSFITYSNDKKISVLGVKKSTIDKFGAVSEECVLEMNEGLYDKTSADVCVSVSGIAGPDGGSLDKPVGTVCIGFNICGKSFAKTYKFRGGRNRIRMHSKNRAFFEIIKVLEQI